MITNSTLLRTWGCALLSLLAHTALAGRSGDGADTASCRMQKLEAERLPDLNTPRTGHMVLLVGDELMVAGGHTTGFVPTPTAEFLRPGDAHWRQQPTAYTHDFGTAVPLRSGQVLLLGGAEQPLGIGQTHGVERFDPATHQFTGFGCLDTKRMYASAEEVDSGRVVVAGNWYHEDNIELFDGRKFFTRQRDVSVQRTSPYIFPIGGGDAIILGGIDTRGGHPDPYPTTVDRLRGEPFDVPLLRHWQPLRLLHAHPTRAGFIGDEAQGDYSYLMVMESRDAELRIALVRDTAITLLPGVPPLPRTGPEGQRIGYSSTVLADREARRAYVLGHDELLLTPPNVPSAGRDSLARHYVYCFSWQEGEAACGSLLYYTDPLPGVGNTTPVLTPCGDVVLVGGVATDNFDPFGAAYRLPLGRPATGREAAALPAAASPWLWRLAALALLAVLLVVAFSAWRRRSPRAAAVEETFPDAADGADLGDGGDDPADDDDTPTLEDAEEVMRRMDGLMEREQLYLRFDLKLGDVADRLGASSRLVSRCIKARTGGNFNQYVNACRVAHAQRLLLEQPGKKVSTVGMESGFNTDASFFRTFKAVVGMSPREWLARQ